MFNMSTVVIYGHVSPNIIDGSSIWLMSIAETLAGVFDQVYVQLKDRLDNDRLVKSVESIPNVAIVEPVGADSLSVEAAVSEVESLVEKVGAEAVIVRGFDAANAFCMNKSIAPRLWSYVTELPFPTQKLSRNNRNRLERIAGRSRRMFAQTEAARSYLEAIVPSAAGKTVLIPPMIPDGAFRLRNRESLKDEPLQLVYAGKLAKDWRTLEMLKLPRALAARGVDSELTVVGNKFNHAADEAYWVDKMRDALQDADTDPTSGVRWLGALSREESLEIISQADIGIGWRSPVLDSSLEISTKALEYGAAGTAPLVNRSADHERLLGDDYPFFVHGDDSVEEIAEKIADNLPNLAAAVDASHRASTSFSVTAARERLRNAFDRSRAAYEKGSSPKVKTKVVIASHDMKFMGELMDYLERSPEFEVEQDRWESLHVHDQKRSRELADWADVIFCEWAGPSLAWYSKNKPVNVRLFSRLHRFELAGPWLSNVEWSNVDGMIFVSELYRRMTIEQLSIDPQKTHVIPNAVDLSDFDRPKLPDARFTLGFIGMVPIHKRPDRAVTLLKALLEHDDRYVLRFKGRMPWEYPYEWKNPVQKQLYLEFFNDTLSDDRVLNHIVFDGFSADIASWQRKIGFMLSPSEVESFHMAPAEGMAARSIPIFWDREGVDEIFGPEFAGRTLDDQVDFILSARDQKVFKSVGEEMRDIARKWDPMLLMARWRDLFLNQGKEAL